MIYQHKSLQTIIKSIINFNYLMWENLAGFLFQDKTIKKMMDNYPDIISIDIHTDLLIIVNGSFPS